MGTLDAFFLMRCFGAVSPEDVTATLKCADVLQAYRPEGSVSIIVIDPTSAFPSEETRRAALEVTRKTTAQTVAQVMVVLGDGFWASAIRGVLTTLGSLSQTTHTRKIVRYEEDAVETAIELLGESPPKYRTVLLAALAQLKPLATSPPTSSKSPPPTSPMSKLPPSSKRRAG
jgi:hypothetical protein